MKESEYPICEVCGERITDDYFIRIEGECYHTRCVEVSLNTYLQNKEMEIEDVY